MEGTGDVGTRKVAEKDKETHDVEQTTDTDKIETSAKKSSVHRDEPDDDCNDNYDNGEARTYARETDRYINKVRKKRQIFFI